MSLKRAARDCAAWIERKVAIRTVRQSGFRHGKLIHVARGADDANAGASADALLGSLPRKEQASEDTPTPAPPLAPSGHPLPVCDSAIFPAALALAESQRSDVYSRAGGRTCR